MDLRNVVQATAQESTRIHAFHLLSDNKRTVCSLPLADVSPFRFDAFLDIAPGEPWDTAAPGLEDMVTCATCERQVRRWLAGE